MEIVWRARVSPNLHSPLRGTHPGHARWNRSVRPPVQQRSTDAAQIGGSVRVYQEFLAPSTISAAAGQTSGSAVYLCSAAPGRGRPLLPQIG